MAAFIEDLELHLDLFCKIPNFPQSDNAHPIAILWVLNRPFTCSIRTIFRPAHALRVPFKNIVEFQIAIVKANSAAKQPISRIRTETALASDRHEYQKCKDKTEEHYGLNVKQLHDDFHVSLQFCATSSFLMLVWS